MIRSRKIVYAVEKNIRGGVTVYGENGIRRYFAKTRAKAVHMYQAQADIEETIALHQIAEDCYKRTGKYPRFKEAST